LKVRDNVDVVIVGSGASGAAAAWRLSKEKSMKVVCIEQGPTLNEGLLPTSKVDWELSRSSDFSSNPEIRQSQYDFPVDCSDSPISIAYFNGFGGSTILYSAHFPRMHPSDFCTYSLDGVGSDWPISHSDLLPFFEINESIMGVAGMVGDPANAHYKTLLPPVQLGQAGIAVAKGFNKLGWHWWPSYGAINTSGHNGRNKCINLGPCNTGCTQAAKGSVDQTYWPLARQQGVEVLTKCQALEVMIDKQGRAKGVLYADELGNLHEIQARVVVLAGNGIGTPRLLMHSRSRYFPDGLGNDSGLLGKNLMLHPLGYVEGTFNEDLRSSIGPQGVCIMSQEFYETNDQRGFKRGYTLQVLRGAPPVETARLGFLMGGVPVGMEHHKKFAQRFNKSVGISIIAEDLPEVHNRIELDWEKRDRHGMPGVKIYYALGDNTKSMLKHGVKAAHQVLEASGGTVVSSFAPVRNAGWHLMGTAKMGKRPQDSVVNQFGQVHGLRNLFVVDSSVFVTSGGVNPVATAQAVTLRACDYICRHWKDLLQ